MNSTPSPGLRWLRFNLVGAMGMAVQLAALAGIHRILPHHDLYASAAAVEIALLHNFVWHIHYTWCDRSGTALIPQLLRWHLSNGLVSMLGNVALMRVLLHQTHLPLLAANGIAILCCSGINFCLSNAWAFAEKQPAKSSPPTSSPCCPGSPTPSASAGRSASLQTRPGHRPACG